MKRMTVNMGARFEKFVGPDQGPDRGRRPLRAGAHLQRSDGSPELVRHLAAPRRVRTTCSAPAGPPSRPRSDKYMAGQTTSFPARYNPLQLQSDTRTWSDTNGDNLAQANEIGPSNNAAFGLPGADVPAGSGHQARVRPRVHCPAPARGRPRPVGELRLLPPRHAQPAPVTRNLNWTNADYTDRQRREPARRHGHPGLQPRPDQARGVNERARRQLDRLRPAPSHLQRHPDRLQRPRRRLPVLRRVDDGPHHRHALRRDREQRRPLRRHGGHCVPPTSRNPTSTGATRASSTCRSCTSSRSPARTRCPGTASRPTSRSRATTVQPLFTRWNIGRTTRYAANCVGPCRPGELVIPNMTLANYTRRPRRARPGSSTSGRTSSTWASARSSASASTQLSGQVDFFNIINSSYVKSQNITYAVQAPGAAFNTFGQPLDILQPRTMRLAAQLKF